MEIIEALNDDFYSRTTSILLETSTGTSRLPSLSTICCSLLVNDRAVIKLTVDMALLVDAAAGFSKQFCFAKYRQQSTMS